MSSPPYAGSPSRLERQAYKWLLKMLDDPARHSAALERWLAEDPERRAVYGRAAGEVGRASDSASLIPSLRPRHSPAPPTRAARGWSGTRRTIAMAIIIVGLAALALLSGPHVRQGHDIGAEARSADTSAYQSGAGIRTVRLNDGSTVLLFPDSRIATRFTNRERAVDLISGRARFAVFRNSAVPFVVYAAGGKVTATGTLFEVTLARRVGVKLLSGSIDVNFPVEAPRAVAKQVRLRPGEQISYPPANEASTVLEKTVAGSAAPVRSIETFDDLPAERIADAVNSRSPTKIVFADPTFGRKEVFADLDTSDANDVAVKLAASLDLVVDHTQAGRLLLKRPN